MNFNKKLIISIIILICLSYFSLSFAQTSTSSTSTPPAKILKVETKLKKKANIAPKVKSKNSKTCLGQKIKELTKEMQDKKKAALHEFKTLYHNATTTNAKKEAKKAYTQKIKEINKWYNDELIKAKSECKEAKPATTSEKVKPATTTPY